VSILFYVPLENLSFIWRESVVKWRQYIAESLRVLRRRSTETNTMPLIDEIEWYTTETLFINAVVSRDFVDILKNFPWSSYSLVINVCISFAYCKIERKKSVHVKIQEIKARTMYFYNSFFLNIQYNTGTNYRCMYKIIHPCRTFEVLYMTYCNLG
jgi:hypothetical protein